ncbi:MAG: CvpA family protein [Verrucomicrobia bacterium]|nr:CvpA family protein [Verrucomicrobiota bacterium]
MNLNLPINLFDLALMVILTLGISAGRKNGMSGELFDAIKWILILVGATLLYEFLGGMVAGKLHLSLLTAYLLVYVAIVFFGLIFLNVVKERVGSKLAGSDFFGRGEYFLGMVAGMVRHACILMIGLALLNARYFSSTDVVAMKAFQTENYGSDMFPTWQTVQSVVFQKSLTGPWIRSNLWFALMKPTKPQDASIHSGEYILP